LGLRQLPSEETLRQRLDQLGTTPVGTLHDESARLIARHAPALTPCHGDWIPLDIYVSPFDNGGTKKEGVALTYKKLEGYAPDFAYLGREGYLMHCELRPGNRIARKGRRCSWTRRSSWPGRSPKTSCWCEWMRATKTARTSATCGKTSMWTGSSSGIRGGLAGGSSGPRRRGVSLERC